jgi:hypothetical protein
MLTEVNLLAVRRKGGNKWIVEEADQQMMGEGKAERSGSAYVVRRQGQKTWIN